MNNDCKIIEDMTMRILNGESVERVIPYHMDGFSEQCIFEMIALYVKYGDKSLPRYEKGLEYVRRANM